MKTTQEFDQFATSLQPKIAELENKRTDGLQARAQKALPIQLIAFGGVGLIVVLVVLRSLLSSSIPKPMLLIPLAFIGFGAYSVYKNKDKVTNLAMNSLAGNAISGGAIDSFKEKVVRPMIAFINPSHTYNPAGEVSYDKIMEADMLEGEGYSSKGNDLVSGVINDVPFEFSDMLVERTYFSNIDQRTITQTIIEGSYFVAEFKKPFANPVYIMANKPQTKNELHYAFKLHGGGENIAGFDLIFAK